VVDPKGELATLVKADKDLGTKIGINHTPTVYIVSTNPSRPYTEVTKPTEELYQTIDAMKR